MEITGADSSWTLPFTVEPSRIAAGGSVKPTFTWKVLVTGSACGDDLAHPAGCLHGRVVGQRDRDARVARCRAQHLRGHVEHRVPPALARQR